MTNTLQRLEARGLVKVSADPGDGRGKLVGLTDAGRDMRERCVESVGPLLEGLSREVSERQIAPVMPVLETVRRYLDSHRDTSAA
jgi:DNA-binding MarR family transcriptional regulator